jgi:hypothetical protein
MRAVVTAIAPRDADLGEVQFERVTCDRTCRMNATLLSTLGGLALARKRLRLYEASLLGGDWTIKERCYEAGI